MPEVLRASEPADPTYGHTLTSLLEVRAPEARDDFEDFWRSMYTSALEVDPSPAVGPGILGTDSRRIVHDVEFTSLGGVRLGGWLSLPADGPIRRGLVVGHGYGGREAPDADVLLEDAAILFFCARGLPTRSLLPEIAAEPLLHVLHGIDRRETYVLGGCAADVWCAVTALGEAVPGTAGCIGYVGVSFGGGTGALALPWDDRIKAACLVVPSFGNHPLRLTLPCTGSGEALRAYARSHPEVVDLLRYFDAATAATFIRIPTHVGVALADPAVPPPGQFAIANALAGPSERFVLTAGHLEYPGMARETAELLASASDFLGRALT